jgi:hypothetical protein
MCKHFPRSYFRVQRGRWIDSVCYPVFLLYSPNAMAAVVLQYRSAVFMQQSSTGIDPQDCTQNKKKRQRLCVNSKTFVYSSRRDAPIIGSLDFRQTYGYINCSNNTEAERMNEGVRAQECGAVR